MFKLDRNVFHAGNHETATGLQAEYWKGKTHIARLQAANYLNSVAFNYPFDNPPKLVRTVFTARKHT